MRFLRAFIMVSLFSVAAESAITSTTQEMIATNNLSTPSITVLRSSDGTKCDKCHKTRKEEVLKNKFVKIAKNQRAQPKCIGKCRKSK